MPDFNPFDDLTQKVITQLPPIFQTMHDDVEKNVRSSLQSSFRKMNLVTREEFDAQSRLLQRSREKLDRLEKQVALLEHSNSC